MEKKNILITGATDGIGKETARALAKQGHKVILHGRSLKKAEAVVREIKAEQPKADLDILTADLLSFRSIEQMTEEFYKRYDYLDVLINNAGAVFSTERVMTEDGEERTFQLNVFAPFLLTNLLLPALEKSKSARVVIESSAAHGAARKPDFDDMHCEKEYGAQSNYSTSKLYVLWMGQHFAKVLKARGVNNVTVNITHPGASNTKFGRDEKKGFLTDLIYKATMWSYDKPEAACQSEVYLATSPEVEGISGRYYSNKSKEQRPNTRYYTPENEQALWDYCVKVCKPWMKQEL